MSEISQAASVAGAIAPENAGKVAGGASAGAKLAAEAVAMSGGSNGAAAGGASTKPARFGGRGLMIAIAAAAVVTVAGIALWVVQLSGGMSQTAMRNLDSWGLYITMFMFFVGLSAGGLIISSAPKAFGAEGFGGISKIAVWTSVCSTVAAIAFVVVDLGRPLRLWELFAYSNLASSLMWDIVVLLVYLVLSVVYLWAQLQAEAGKVSHTALRVVSVITLVTAVLVHSVTAWIFGLQQGREMWHTALLGPWFVSSALVGGFQIPNIDYAGVMTPMTVTNWDAGMQGAYQGMVYWPAPIEWGVALGVIGLAALLLCAGLRYLPLKPVE